MSSIPHITDLRLICQATAPNPARESFLGKFSRRFSIYGTWVLLHTNITPNQITVFSVVVFFLGTGCFLFDMFVWNLFGSFLIFLSIILDGCDGEVARFRKKASLAGTNYVEPVSHDIQYGVMFPLLGFGLVFLHGYPFVIAFAGTIAGITKLLYRALEMRFWFLQHSKEKITDEKIEEIKNAYTKKSSIVRFGYWINKNFFSSTGICLCISFFSVIDYISGYLFLFSFVYSCLFFALFIKQIYYISTHTI